jgi:hypothetical protein
MIPFSLGFYSVPSPNKDTPTFLWSGNVSWAENHGPLLASPTMTILSWLDKFSWDSRTQNNAVIETDVGSCRYTTDKSELATADLVGFFWDGMYQNTVYPTIKRPHGTLWMYYAIESTGNGQMRNDEAVKILNGEINLLATYQVIADIRVRFYGYFVERQQPLEKPLMPDWSMKNEMAVSVVSNNGAPHRMKFLQV